MEKEVSMAMQISVSLIAISALLSIVLFTVYLGQEVKVEAFDVANRMVIDSEVGLLEDLVGQENEMPMATAYSILRTYSRVIAKVTCHDSHHGAGVSKVTDLTEGSPCLLEHMRGRVSLEVKKIEEGWYEVIVHKQGCTWYYTSCDC